jgi:hypothetical protein
VAAVADRGYRGPRLQIKLHRLAELKRREPVSNPERRERAREVGGALGEMRLAVIVDADDRRGRKGVRRFGHVI